MGLFCWILERVRDTAAKAATLLGQYGIGQARHEIDALFWDDSCDHYIEIVKQRLYQPKRHGTQGKRAAQYALYHALLGILKLYAAYVPHITEYLYQSFFRQYENTVSIHLLRRKRLGTIDANLLAYGTELKQAVCAMRRYKSARNQSMKAEIDFLEIQTVSSRVE